MIQVLVGHPSPNIYAKFQATTAVLPLGGVPFVNIKSRWTQYDCCPGQGGPKSLDGPNFLSVPWSSV